MFTAFVTRYCVAVLISSEVYVITTYIYCQHLFHFFWIFLFFYSNVHSTPFICPLNTLFYIQNSILHCGQ